MYTLRTVHANQKRTNQLIGNIYSVIEKDFNYEEFVVYYKELYGKEHIKDAPELPNDEGYNVYAFIQHLGDTIPLYENSYYYVMTESGKTFSNLSYRK